MSFDLTQEALQSIAVRVVSQYMTKQSCMSEAIANEAKTLELNPEQIKRVIEASNTIAYLRQLEDAHDRTFEFPIAEYRDVMGRMVLPDQSSPVVSQTIEPSSLPAAEKAEVISSISEQEKVAMLVKETLRVKQVLTKMAEDGYMVSMQLEKLANEFSKDPLALEKLAHVSSKENLESIKVLCGLEKSSSTGNNVFTNAELSDAISLNSLFKEARDLILEQKEKEDFIKRATEILIKQGKFSPIGSTVEGIGKGMGWAVGKVGKGGVKAVKRVGAGVAALTAGKTLSQRIERGADIAGAAVTAPTIEHENPVWKTLHG